MLHVFVIDMTVFRPPENHSGGKKTEIVACKILKIVATTFHLELQS